MFGRDNNFMGRRPRRRWLAVLFAIAIVLVALTSDARSADRRPAHQLLKLKTGEVCLCGGTSCRALVLKDDGGKPGVVEPDDAAESAEETREPEAEAEEGILEAPSAPTHTTPVEQPEAVFPLMEEERSNPPFRYRLHAAVGAPLAAGEFHAHAQGLSSSPAPQAWLFEYTKRFRSSLRGGWQPVTKVRLSHTGHSASMRCSKALLTDSGDGGEPLADGSGLDVNMETSVESPWPDANHQSQDQFGNIMPQTPPGPPQAVWRQKAEVVVGPRAQAKYLNLTLPMGVLLGAELRSGGGIAEDSMWAGGPLSLYARFEMPGIRELSGLMGEGEVEDQWAGRLQGSVAKPFGKDAHAHWSLEHMRTHGLVRLPRALVGKMMQSGGWISSALGLGPGAPSPTLVPGTRVQASCNGCGATLALKSSQAGLGGPGWGGSVEMTTAGWGAGVKLSAGNADSGMGQPMYSVLASAPWGSPMRLLHEFKLMLADGQGVWAKVDGSRKGGPRLNFGLEVR